MKTKLYNLMGDVVGIIETKAWPMVFIARSKDGPFTIEKYYLSTGRKVKDNENNDCMIYWETSGDEISL